MSSVKNDNGAVQLEKPRVSQGGVLAPSALARQISALARHASPASRFSAASDLQVVFLCDTTGSMYPYFDRVRASINRIVARVAQEKIRAEFAVYAYKNHGDEAVFGGGHPFLHQPFATDPAQIARTLAEVKRGGGGADGLCAVEDAFHHLNTQMISGASLRTKRVAIVIGDMPPHGVVDKVSHCPHEYDYQAEVAAIHRKGFTFYSVFCSEGGELESARKQKIQEYFKWLPRQTGGKYLDLTDIDAIVDLLLAICMKETGRLDAFVAELEKRRALPPSMRRLLLALKAPEK